tara:strand:+ start:33992 stop:35887 length:1896 start_codon:yes stop_codon:yes gene_type:complete
MIAMALCSIAAFAKDTLTQQRETYKQAKHALETHKRAKYEAVLPKLENYPLYPYLLYSDLSQRMGSLPNDEIAAFLQTYPNTAVSEKLRRKWFKTLANQHQWEVILANYQETDDPLVTCVSLRALIWQGKKELAYQKLPKLWLTGKSQVEECDPVFDAWLNSEALSSTLIWQRIQLAFDVNNIGLVNYLIKQLPEAERDTGYLWLSVNYRPETMMTDEAFKQEFPLRSAILTHGLKRQAYRDPIKAEKNWLQLSSEVPFSDAEKAIVNKAIAKGFVRRKPEMAASRIAKVEATEDNKKLYEWQVRSELRAKNIAAIEKWYELLPKDQQQNPLWRYWYARSIEVNGKPKQAQAIYQKLALGQNYYSYLAADKINKAKLLQSKPLTITAEERKTVENNPAIIRAREFYAIKDYQKGNKEWWYAFKNMTPKQQYIAAKLSREWGLNTLSAYTAAKLDYQEDMVLRFPTFYANHVNKKSKRLALSPALVFAMIRQESLFKPNAKSHAGARGLMQLMPRTAKQVSKKIKSPYTNPTSLYDPNYNILLGTTYLKELLDRFDNHSILAIASYNAGPHRVVRWLPEQGTVDADIWIETVPFKETRDYLKRVVAYSIIYQQLLNPNVHYTPVLRDIPNNP